MKLKKILNEILQEGKQVGDVYHFTKLRYALKIADSNFIKAGRATKNINGKTISTTRDKGFSKTRSNSLQIQGADIAFKLDGNKLSNRYKVMPYDDTFDRTDKEYDQDDVKQFGDEQEEVWYGNTLESDGGFKNLKNYVIQIILTKRLLKSIVQTPDNLAHDIDDNVGDLKTIIGDFNIPPTKKLNELKKWFEDRGYNVEIEK